MRLSATRARATGRDDDHSIANLPMSGMRGALAAPGARVLEVSTGSERTVVIAELDARLAVHGDGNSDGGDATGGGGGGGGLVEAIAAAARETKEAQRRGGAQRSVVSWSDSSEPVEVRCPPRAVRPRRAARVRACVCACVCVCADPSCACCVLFSVALRRSRRCAS